MGLDLFFNKKKEETIGYFRKVNFLIPFFERKGLDVESQKGITIQKEDAEELLDLCKKVLNDHSKAEELLPTRAGFFFGSTVYDDYYFQDVEDIKDFLINTLIPEFKKLDNKEYITFDIWY